MGTTVTHTIKGDHSNHRKSSLVAPTSVEFYSAEGERLGNKYTLVQELNSITGICAEALRGIPLDQFSVDVRMSWVGRRETIDALIFSQHFRVLDRGWLYLGA